MHALRRPHLSRAVALTALAAMIAIVLTLAFASTLSDLTSSPAGAFSPSPATHPSLTASAAGGRTITPAWTLSPFSSLLSTPIADPWAQHNAP